MSASRVSNVKLSTKDWPALNAKRSKAAAKHTVGPIDRLVRHQARHLRKLLRSRWQQLGTTGTGLPQSST